VSCAAIMSKDPASVRADETIETAAKKLIAHQFISLPVVDAQNRYFGMFGIYDLLCMLVPRVALAGNLLPNLRFISDNPEELRARFREVKSRLVSDAADRNAATLKPDTPEIEAIRLFCQSHSSLAVVDPESRRVLGIVSCWDAVRAIVGETT
jgi:CBS-domain-containing membrane protein